jgi:glucosamine-6-phosphate deaminase
MVAMNKMNISNLSIHRFDSRGEMGRGSALQLVGTVEQLLNTKEFVNIVFASAPSQNEFIRALRTIESVEWKRIRCFHLDEYVGLSPEAPQSFSHYLQEELFRFKVPHAFFAINGLNSPDEEFKRYSDLLQKYPLDIACIGIGENGHIAFNDPHVADFHDSHLIKQVGLDEASRQQQVNDECFSSLEDVPHEALTLTIPAILSASRIICTVPGERKREAVRKTLYGPVDVSCPASALRNAKECHLFLDRESASLIDEWRTE